MIDYYYWPGRGNIKNVYDSMTAEQKHAVYILVGKALENVEEEKAREYLRGVEDGKKMQFEKGKDNSGKHTYSED